MTFISLSFRNVLFREIVGQLLPFESPEANFNQDIRAPNLQRLFFTSPPPQEVDSLHSCIAPPLIWSVYWRKAQVSSLSSSQRESLDNDGTKRLHTVIIQTLISPYFCGSGLRSSLDLDDLELSFSFDNIDVLRHMYGISVVGTSTAIYIAYLAFIIRDRLHRNVSFFSFTCV